LIIFIGKAKSALYFYFRFIWPINLESVPCVEPPVFIISTKFEVDTTIHRRVTALRDLVTLTFDLLTMDSSQRWLVTWSSPPPSEDPMPIRSWLMSYDVHHRPPLTMSLEPLRMRRITWPVRRG